MSVFSKPQIKENNFWQICIPKIELTGNISEGISLTLDNDAPFLGENVHYSNGVITMQVKDTGSGIVRIGDTTYSNYTTNESVTIPTGTQSVEIEDGVGHKTTVAIDAEAPIIKGALKNNGSNEVIVEAEDSGGSGLWKVVESNSADAQAIGYFISDLHY